MKSRPLRVGAVGFLNTVPLIEGLDDERGIEVSRDLPSRLAHSLAAGDIDVGLIPAAEYLRGVGSSMVPGLCIGAHGAVRTVKVFSRVPLREVERVSVDRGSRTSVALLRILLAELHGITPELEEFEPRRESLFDRAPTALVIGDRADEIDATDLHVHDLGQIWNDLTGLPFVFAAWVFSAELGRPERVDDRRRLVTALHRAAERGRGDLDRLARREAAARGWDLHRITSYWREFVQFDLGAAELAGLRRFAELGARHGVIEHPREVAVAEA